MNILILNCGSSSLKFALYDSGGACLGKGLVAGLPQKAKRSGEGCFAAWDAELAPELQAILKALLAWLERQGLMPLAAVGHRVVHGGTLAEAVPLTSANRDYLQSLIPLAPLHQPFSLQAVELMAALDPALPQVACFDTSFHTTIPALHRRFGLPRVWHDKGVKRYGFHGLSYDYIAGRLKELAPRAYGGRTIIAHLGSGASLCALKDGKSFETSMSFSPLDGLMMGTRPGALDSGVLLYLLREGLDVAGLEQLLYRESGLLGVSGMTPDMAVLLASEEPTAREAVDLFCHRITREAGAMIGLMGGLDAIAFTGGMGERSAIIRERVCASLAWTGLALDTAKNKAASSAEAARLTAEPDKVDVWMIPTDEESVMARQTRVVLGT